MKAPEAVVPHNGTETVNNQSKRDSAKLSITCSSIVTKVQNGGVTRHSRGLYKIILIRLMIILARVMMSTREIKIHVYGIRQTANVS